MSLYTRILRMYSTATDLEAYSDLYRIAGMDFDVMAYALTFTYGKDSPEVQQLYDQVYNDIGEWAAKYNLTKLSEEEIGKRRRMSPEEQKAYDSQFFVACDNNGYIQRNTGGSNGN